MQTEFKSWDDLAHAVHAWSLANFGSQKGLGCLVPLLGVIEEIDEYCRGVAIEEKEDAIGDICIFLLDYCKRSGADLTSIPVAFDQKTFAIGFWSGRLCHARVKRIQGIRGMESLESFRKAELEAVAGILRSCDGMSESLGGDGAFATACKTWNDVVAKRKWHTQPDKPITFESACEDFKNVASELNWGLS